MAVERVTKKKKETTFLNEQGPRETGGALPGSRGPLVWTYVTSAFTASWGGCLKNNTIDRLRRRFSAVLPQFLACLGLDYIQTIDVVCISLTLPQTRVLSFFYLISFFLYFGLPVTSPAYAIALTIV